VFVALRGASAFGLFVAVRSDEGGVFSLARTSEGALGATSFSAPLLTINGFGCGRTYCERCGLGGVTLVGAGGSFVMGTGSSATAVLFWTGGGGWLVVPEGMVVQPAREIRSGIASAAPVATTRRRALAASEALMSIIVARVCFRAASSAQPSQLWRRGKKVQQALDQPLAMAMAAME